MASLRRPALDRVVDGRMPDSGPAALHRWQLVLDDGSMRGIVELPAHLEDELPEDVQYTLRTQVELPPDWRGQPLTLSVSQWQGLPEVWVADTAVYRTTDVGAEIYRAMGPQTWIVPAELTERDVLPIEIRIEFSWTQAAWLDTVPRLTRGRDGDPLTNFVDRFNRWTGGAGLGALSTVALIYLVLFFTDRSPIYGWFGMFAGAASMYLVHQLALGQLVFGQLDTTVMGLSLCLAVYCSVRWTHLRFEFGPPGRIWHGILGTGVLVGVVVRDPHRATQIFAPLVVLSLAIVILYQIVTSIRLLRRDDPPPSTWVNLCGWVSIALGAAADALPWVALGEPLEGVRIGGLALAGLALSLVVGLSRDHVLSLRQAATLNVELGSGVELLDGRKREIEQLNEELRRQIAQRSRQLSEALAKLARGTSRVHALSPGDVVDERYRVLELLGAGAMGSVHRVERVTDGAAFALKVLKKSDDVHEVARFAREAQIASEVHHPNVVGIVDVGVSGTGLMYLVLELIEGPSLANCADRFGELLWGLQVVREVAVGLAALHRHGVVHRDLKPANILLASVDPVRAKISDFGISGQALGRMPLDSMAESVVRDGSDAGGDAVTKRVAGLALQESGEPSSARSSSPLTRTGLLLGTPVYMAPEAALGAQHVHTAADVFSLAVVAFEILIGRRPFSIPPVLARLHGKPLETLPSFEESLPALPRPAAEILGRSMRVEPSERPTARELVEVLEQSCATMPSPADRNAHPGAP